MNKIIIDVGSERKPINPMIYGNFLEHLGECVKNGMWAYDPVNVPLVQDNFFLEGIRQDVLEAGKNIKVSVLRAFGGCYADVYHWMDAIGPRGSRKKVKNKQWARFPYKLLSKIGPKIENQFGTDEFLHFCEAIGAEPYLNINYSTGTLEEGANWVEYCNGSVDTEFGALRAKNGRKEPYNVKFWGIANEIWGPQEKGREKYPENYAKKYLEFAKVMRKKDPTIKLVVVGWWHSRWNQTVLRLIGEEWVDYLSMHKYVPIPMNLSFFLGKHPAKEKKYYSLMASYRKIEEEIENGWTDITSALGEDTHVRIAFDEWGIWYKARDLIRTNLNLQDGLGVALIFMVFQRHSDKSPMALLSEFINIISGTILTDPDGIILTPAYLALKMIRHHSFSNLVNDVEVNCETFSNKKFGQIKKYDDTPYLSCNATINDAGNELSILLVNKHFTDNIKVDLEIKGLNPKESGTLIVLNSDSPFDYNTIENRNKVQIQEENTNNLKNIVLPAHSFSILKIKK